MELDRFVLGSSPYGPDAPRPYRRALRAPQFDISSAEPCPFTKVPDGPQTLCLNVLWVQERNPDILSFSLEKSQQANSFQVPHLGHCGETYLPTGQFYVSLHIYIFLSFLQSPPLRYPLHAP